MDTDRSGGNSKDPPASNQGGDANQLGAQRGQKTRQTSGLSLDKEIVVHGHLIFDLLFHNKSQSGEPGTDASAIAEAKGFWQHEEEDFVAKMQESDSKRDTDEEIVLPEDIMPSFGQMMQEQGADLIKTSQGGPKK
jgi:hypothetical protein